ncbi:MAG: hypothetical protein OXL38_22285 [Gammaproteobacteria bacterium]|nr:hypothetical protein [Gammaproteobacteria bacterium]
MHGWETRMRLRHCLDQGISKAEQSRRFGSASGRSTGGSRGAPGPGSGGRPGTVFGASAGAAQAGSVQPYNPIIDARLAVFPCCPRRLFDEVCVAGYAGGYGRVRDYVRMVPPCEPAEPWSLRDAPGPPGTGGLREFTLPWGRHHALLVLLGHSRPTYCGCVSPPTDDGRPLIDGLESAFERFGGVC